MDKNKKLSRIAKFKCHEIWEPRNREINVSRKFHVISYLVDFLHPGVERYPFKGATSRYFKSFLRRPKHGLSVGKPKTNGFLMKENTKGVILRQRQARMAEDVED